MDFGRAFTFVKDDERWITKIAIGAGITLLSILLLGIPAILLIGYQLAVTRQVMEGKDLPLPEWDNWGKLFMDGLYLVVAIFVYTLPIWIIFCLGFGGFFLVPLFSGNEDVASIVGGAAVLTWFVMLCIVVILGIGMALVIPGLYIQYIRTNEFGSLFRIGEVLGIVRENIADILLSMVAVIAANFVLQAVNSVLSWTCIVPIILGLAGPIWINISMGHLYGQIAAKNKSLAV
ncbi:MAG: DUF4013 domain-containing protein [Candidatus Promineifilaceae bacterium]